MENKKIAIVIGTSEYQNDMRTLASPAQDAMNLAHVLQDPKIGNYEVKLFINASSYNVNQAIESFFSNRQIEDTLLLYFSGHGIKDERGRLYFATTDTRMDLLRSSAVSATYINEIMSMSRSRRQIVLLDCCFSGAFIKEGEVLSGGRVAITASDSMQMAFEKEDELIGVFTSAMIEGLETGNADINRDGQISVFELYQYIYKQLTLRSAKQTPLLWTLGVRGDLVVANSHRKD